MSDLIQAVPREAAGPAAPSLRTGLAAAGGLAVAAMAVTGLVLQIANGGAEAPNGRDYTWGVLTACASFGVPGALLVLRGTAVRIGALSLAIGLSLGLAAVATGWSVAALEADPGSFPGAEVPVWLLVWCWVPGYCAIPTLLLLMLPDGRLPSRRWRPVVATL